MAPEVPTRSPAELAAEEAQDQVYELLSQRKSFILEAGAGAGKTYTLNKVLEYLIERQGLELLRKRQQIACITYTNVAKNEIEKRVDGNPAVLAETIHAFCWALLKEFQPSLRRRLESIGKWSERLSEAGVTDLENRTIKYDLGYPKIDDKHIWLYHDDVISFMVELLAEPKFRRILTSGFPILLIDEYQDTDKRLTEAIERYFLDTESNLLIGFFGDHWQKIYGTGCGRIDNSHLEQVSKRANFRSVKPVVDVLNKIRPDLPQEVRDPVSEGFVRAYHTNAWRGTRRAGAHWSGDLPADEAHRKLEEVKVQLASDGWDFNPGKTKILMLTHNVLADEQGYRDLANVFSRTESYTKKEDDYISFFVDTLEPGCSAFENRKYGEMLSYFGDRITITNHQDKVRMAESLRALITLQSTGTIGNVLDHLKSTKYPRLSESVEQKESQFILLKQKPASDRSTEEGKFIEKIEKLRNVPYRQVAALAKFIDEKTPFSTKHSVKGAEFENVLVVFGRGWNQYDFGQMMEWTNSSIPAGKEDTYERNLNLFYVACSRPKKRLALLFTQVLSDSALNTLTSWFGSSSVKDVG
jgi:DNA helicase-2/ATP-dependent DNA helicase PcrA